MRLALAAGVLALGAIGLSAQAASAATLTVVPTTFTDTTASDPNDVGMCATPGATPCSLREAINLLQKNASDGTVDLTNAPLSVSYQVSNGPLTINPPGGNPNPTIGITGSSPRLVTITDKGATTPSGIFSITGATVTISGVTITGGAASGSNGGAINNNAVLTLNNDEITGNSSTASTLSSAAGGGVYNNAGTLTVSNSTITGNTATTGSGGTGASGGGIATNAGALNVTNTTITGNTASGTSVAGTASGGGIAQIGAAAVMLANVTLNGNTASNVLGTASGGNLAVSGSGSMSSKNTIISGGTANSGSNCTAAVTSLGYNLEDKNQCSFNATGDQVSTDPQLQPLGPSPTGTNFTDVETVAVTSPAIDRGNPAGCTNALGAALATDQEANPRGKPCDIGAYETILPPRLVTGPAVTGTPQTGQLLTCSGATFSGITPITLSYAWLRNGIAIAGATAPTYTPVAPDVGQGIACSVTATNVDGTFSATSAAVSVALPPLPPFDGVTLLKTRFTLKNSQVILPVQCSKVAIFGCGGIVKITVAGSGSSAATAAKAKKKKKHHKPSVPHPTTLGTATFKFSTAQVATIPVLISHDAKLEIASRPHGRQAVTIAILAYDGLSRQKITTYSGEITAPTGTVKKHKKKRTRHKR